MLKRSKVKKEIVIDHIAFNQSILHLADELKVSVEEIRDRVKLFIISEISEWKQSKAEVVDNEFNIKIMDTGQILKVSDAPLSVLRKIRFCFKNLVQEVRNKNTNKILSENVGKLIYGSIVKVIEDNTFVNALEACFKVPNKHFLQTDLLEEDNKYLFYVTQNKITNDIFLTRVSYDFFVELLKLYIPEIKDGIIEILKVYRIFGGKTHIFFKSSIDNALSHCLGGSSDKLQHMMRELSGEKLNFIDIAKGFYKAIATLLRIEKFFTQVILHKQDDICYVYVDYALTHRLIQKQLKHMCIIKDIFNVHVELTFINSEEEYGEMLRTCFAIEIVSEIKTLCSLLPNICHLYKVCPSVLGVKFLISSDTVEHIFRVLLRTIENDEQHAKISEKLIKSDSSILDYKNK